MAKLSWGYGALEYAESSDGAVASDATWTALEEPKQDTLKLTTTAGTETVAYDETGDVVDSRNAKNQYTIEWDTFVKKGSSRPFEDTDGIVDGEWALRFTPEDDECVGFLAERTKIRVEESFSTADGILLHYVARALKPASGKTIKEYTASA